MRPIRGMRFATGVLLIALTACARPAEAPEPAATEVVDATPPALPVRPSGPAKDPEPQAQPAPKPKVILVVLESFPDDLVDAVEDDLESKLDVEVVRHGVVPLPKSAYYPPRRRYRAERLLDHLDTFVPDGAPKTTKVLGLTEVDISTTKEPHEDWGIFGLGALDDRSCVISSFRLRKRARPAKVRFRVTNTALHEVGHTFGLPHCTEPRCVMLDAEGGITNTDTSSGEFGPACRAKFESSLEG